MLFRRLPNPPAPRTLARLLLPLAALGSLAGGCGLGEADDYAPLTITDNFRVIEPQRAYRSAQLDATTLRLAIREYGLRTIVNLRGANEQDVWYQRERAVAAELGVRFVDVRMSAAELPARETLLLLYDTFIDAPHPILIHCKSGADRTGAASAIWRMVVNGEPRSAAQRELSPLFGHFERATPEMDRLAEMFRPDRAWVENEYAPQ